MKSATLPSFWGTLRQTYAGYQDKGKEGILSLVGVPLPSVVAPLSASIKPENIW
ncbi:hypothetical protein [Candidatus Kuenenia stuttgartiensis]|uniref:hypothetical protein n=1 Tax=Kuenenia stuttgartiensis TaxID=174633 RepID=UPI001B8C4ADD|nr:hypothetical protein [Candidatus Kuenenia stuttgartiensis]